MLKDKTPDLCKPGNTMNFGQWTANMNNQRVTPKIFNSSLGPPKLHLATHKSASPLRRSEAPTVVIYLSPFKQDQGHAQPYPAFPLHRLGVCDFMWLGDERDEQG